MDLTDENIVKKSNDIQKGEMEKHKWFLSELVHRDMGSAALIDWTNLYAKQWRESFNRELDEEIALIKSNLINDGVFPTEDIIKEYLIDWLKNYTGPIYN